MRSQNELNGQRVQFAATTPSWTPSQMILLVFEVCYCPDAKTKCKRSFQHFKRACPAARVLQFFCLEPTTTVTIPTKEAKKAFYVCTWSQGNEHSWFDLIVVAGLPKCIPFLDVFTFIFFQQVVLTFTFWVILLPNRVYIQISSSFR